MLEAVVEVQMKLRLYCSALYVQLARQGKQSSQGKLGGQLKTSLKSTWRLQSNMNCQMEGQVVPDGAQVESKWRLEGS